MLVLAVSIVITVGFKTGGAPYQFVESHPWIPAFGAGYTLGVDGIAVVLVLLTTVLVPLLLVAGELAPGDAYAALRAGVRAVLPSELLPEQLLAALEAVAAGLVVMHPADVDGALAEVRSSGRPLRDLVEPLTRREREVLQMVAAGSGNKEIAAKLGISEHTVKFHVAAILGKLGAESRTEAVALGIRRGLVML